MMAFALAVAVTSRIAAHVLSITAARISVAPFAITPDFVIDAKASRRRKIGMRRFGCRYRASISCHRPQ
jgi:hypothetical protein